MPTKKCSWAGNIFEDFFYMTLYTRKNKYFYGGISIKTYILNHKSSSFCICKKKKKKRKCILAGSIFRIFFSTLGTLSTMKNNENDNNSCIRTSINTYQSKYRFLASRKQKTSDGEFDKNILQPHSFLDSSFLSPPPPKYSF